MALTPAAEKLITTATRLFYERGITASGVDTIAAEAKVSKPTLYAHFSDKDGLVVAVLEHQHALRRESLIAHLFVRTALPTEKRLLSIFDWVEAQQHGDWQRGCPFVNASVELGEQSNEAATQVVLRHKTWFRGILADLVAEMNARSPAVLASQLHLLVEGANARMLAEKDLTAVVDAKQAAEALLAAAANSKSK